YDSSTANNLNSSHQFVSPTVKCRCHKLKVIAVMQLEIFGALFSAAMEKRLSRKVKLNCKIDKSVMAGVIIRAGDMVIDGSVRGR
ncbi:F0F1 ATP synthase subunit delta, partial [Salmonella enterica subsp. enterica serovar Montevideo]|nr:F0F1 ATP synthase subunit delta [Salmonella enterica subsp. enterica serovar Montevideo]